MTVMLKLSDKIFKAAVIMTPTYLERSSSGIISFCLFILFMGFLRQESWRIHDYDVS